MLILHATVNRDCDNDGILTIINMWMQHEITLRPRHRGFHLIQDEVVAGLPGLSSLNVGLCHLLLQHSSASLLLGESYDPDVRLDMEAWANRCAAENEAYYQHTCEGSDDMPAHIKTSIFGCSLTLPIRNGALAIGMWQGLWLGEHRDHGGSRRIIATLHGSHT